MIIWNNENLFCITITHAVNHVQLMFGMFSHVYNDTVILIQYNNDTANLQ